MLNDQANVESLRQENMSLVQSCDKMRDQINNGVARRAGFLQNGDQI